MASNHTTNYQLCQWEATDKVLRTDFNQDNQKIDAALAAVPKIAAGTYTGNGAAARTISLPFTPQVVFLCDQAGHTAEDITYLQKTSTTTEGSPWPGTRWWPRGASPSYPSWTAASPWDSRPIPIPTTFTTAITAARSTTIWLLDKAGQGPRQSRGPWSCVSSNQMT